MVTRKAFIYTIRSVWCTRVFTAFGSLGPEEVFGAQGYLLHLVLWDQKIASFKAN
jgi:hypothetical protein